MTDSSKKRSIIEIKRQFKAKILEKFPVRNVTKNTICIPGQAVVETVPVKEIAKVEASGSKVSSQHVNSSDDDQINKEALMAYYNTTGLPDTTTATFHRDGGNSDTRGIPIAQDLIVHTPISSTDLVPQPTTVTIVNQTKVQTNT